ncbi:hypothetical protein H7Y21_00250 [Arenimonas sp.]|nr:hypothetical protein [Candidatus Parcubacteria bacterium]
MKWHIIKTPNGVIITIQAEEGDDEDQVQILRNARKGLADESSTIEGIKDEITFFRALKWPDEKTPDHTS